MRKRSKTLKQEHMCVFGAVPLCFTAGALTSVPEEDRAAQENCLPVSAERSSCTCDVLLATPDQRGSAGAQLRREAKAYDPAQQQQPSFSHKQRTVM